MPIDESATETLWHPKYLCERTRLITASILRLNVSWAHQRSRCAVGDLTALPWRPHFVSTACSSERRSTVRYWCATVGVRDCNAPTSAFCITRISSSSQPGVTVLLDQRFLFFFCATYDFSVGKSFKVLQLVYFSVI